MAPIIIRTHIPDDVNSVLTRLKARMPDLCEELFDLTLPHGTREAFFGDEERRIYGDEIMDCVLRIIARENHKKQHLKSFQRRPPLEAPVRRLEELGALISPLANKFEELGALMSPLSNKVEELGALISPLSNRALHSASQSTALATIHGVSSATTGDIISEAARLQESKQSVDARDNPRERSEDEQAILDIIHPNLNSPRGETEGEGADVGSARSLAGKSSHDDSILWERKKQAAPVADPEPASGEREFSGPAATLLGGELGTAEGIRVWSENSKMNPSAPDYLPLQPRPRLTMDDDGNITAEDKYEQAVQVEQQHWLKSSESKMDSHTAKGKEPSKPRTDDARLLCDEADPNRHERMAFRGRHDAAKHTRYAIQQHSGNYELARLSEQQNHPVLGAQRIQGMTAAQPPAQSLPIRSAAQPILPPAAARGTVYVSRELQPDVLRVSGSPAIEILTSKCHWLHGYVESRSHRKSPDHLTTWIHFSSPEYAQAAFAYFRHHLTMVDRLATVEFMFPQPELVASETNFQAGMTHQQPRMTAMSGEIMGNESGQVPILNIPKVRTSKVRQIQNQQSQVSSIGDTATVEGGPILPERQEEPSEAISQVVSPSTTKDDVRASETASQPPRNLTQMLLKQAQASSHPQAAMVKARTDIIPAVPDLHLLQQRSAAQSTMSPKAARAKADPSPVKQSVDESVSPTETGSFEAYATATASPRSFSAASDASSSPVGTVLSDLERRSRRSSAISILEAGTRRRSATRTPPLSTLGGDRNQSLDRPERSTSQSTYAAAAAAAAHSASPSLPSSPVSSTEAVEGRFEDQFGPAPRTISPLAGREHSVGPPAVFTMNIQRSRNSSGSGSERFYSAIEQQQPQPSPLRTCFPISKTVEESGLDVTKQIEESPSGTRKGGSSTPTTARKESDASVVKEVPPEGLDPETVSSIDTVAVSESKADRKVVESHATTLQEPGGSEITTDVKAGPVHEGSTVRTTGIEVEEQQTGDELFTSSISRETGSASSQPLGFDGANESTPRKPGKSARKKKAKKGKKKKSGADESIDEFLDELIAREAMSSTAVTKDTDPPAYQPSVPEGESRLFDWLDLSRDGNIAKSFLGATYSDCLDPNRVPAAEESLEIAEISEILSYDVQGQAPPPYSLLGAPKAKGSNKGYDRMDGRDREADGPFDLNKVGIDVLSSDGIILRDPRSLAKTLDQSDTLPEYSTPSSSSENYQARLHQATAEAIPSWLEEAKNERGTSAVYSGSDLKNAGITQALRGSNKRMKIRPAPGDRTQSSGPQGSHMEEKRRALLQQLGSEETRRALMQGFAERSMTNIDTFDELIEDVGSSGPQTTKQIVMPLSRFESLLEAAQQKLGPIAEPTEAKSSLQRSHLDVERVENPEMGSDPQPRAEGSRSKGKGKCIATPEQSDEEDLEGAATGHRKGADTQTRTSTSPAKDALPTGQPEVGSSSKQHDKIERAVPGSELTQEQNDRENVARPEDAEPATAETDQRVLEEAKGSKHKVRITENGRRRRLDT